VSRGLTCYRILNNWLHDAWGYEQKPDGKPIRKLGNGIFLDWDTSNTTVRDNWIYNSTGGAIKTIWDNQNLVIEGNVIADGVAFVKVSN